MAKLFPANDTWRTVWSPAHWRRFDALAATTPMPFISKFALGQRVKTSDALFIPLENAF